MRTIKISLIALSLSTLMSVGLLAQEQQRPNQAPPTPNQPQQLPDQAQPGQDQPKQDQPQSATYTGTIVKDGEQFLLHETSGGIYKLDDSARAQAFEGKSVKVTGKLDTDAKLIHVETIEPVSA